MKEREFKEMLQSIGQARAIRKGMLRPGRVFKFEPKKIKTIRQKLKMTQTQFAALLLVSPATLRNWEQGRTYPDGPAIALLRVAEIKPEAVLEALHAA
jgi:putative transcriptional regulator